MILSNEQLDLRFQRCTLALSVRRLRDHAEFGQVNPFPPIPAVGEINPRLYIDIVNMSGPVQILTGLTLQDASDTRQTGIMQTLLSQLLTHLRSPVAREWLGLINAYLHQARERQATRNLPQPFIPPEGGSAFGLRGLHSSLKHWLDEHCQDKATAQQWDQRIGNLSKNGLRADELAFSGLAEALAVSSSEGNDAGHEPEGADTVVRSKEMVTGGLLSEQVCFDALRLSILPVIYPASAQLGFEKVPANATVKRIKPKLKAGLKTLPQWRDRVLGYWIDLVEWADLLGPTRGWMAFTHRGEAVTDKHRPSGLCTTLAEAQQLANRHARMVMPKISTEGFWSEYRLTGGAEYREWVVTLPDYAPSYYSAHFEHRNVLLHLRCDVREGPDGRWVLLLQEIQSDWAQQARREKGARSKPGAEPLPLPPWMNEWPALALKLALLHAVQSHVDAIAWTPGLIQAQRYGGSGKEALLDFYDRTLPEEASRLLKPYDRQCTQVEVFQPQNFFIDPDETGYRVLNQEGACLGRGVDWSEAQALVPDGAHEELIPMHGIVLDEELKKAILADGFFAWGSGIRTG